MSSGSDSHQGMTGFGRAQGQSDWGSWAWEIRSVNGRGLDVRVSTPPGHEAVEFEARKRIRERLQRGNLQAQLRIELNVDRAATRLRTRELSRLAAKARSWRAAGVRAPSFLELIQHPTVQSTGARNGDADDSVAAELLSGLDEALNRLLVARRSEGSVLIQLLFGFLDQMRAETERARELADAQPLLVRDRLSVRLAELVGRDGVVDPERILQEASLLAARSDVKEELDRLFAHIASAREILAGPPPVGRKLDFLSQELNREANTLCSKSASLELTNTGLNLKSLIEQFREQVQNVG